LLTFSGTNVAPVFTPILAGGPNIVSAPALGSVGYVLTVGAGSTTAWTSVSSLPAGNASSLESSTWEIPGTIGSTTPSTGAFTTLTASTGYNGIIGNSTPAAATFTTITTSTSSSSFVLAPTTITNTNVDPRTTLAILGPNISSGNTNRLYVGKDLTLGNSIGIWYYHNANNSSLNTAVFGFFGNNPGQLQLYNSASTAATISAPFTSTGVITGTQLVSNIANGTAPLLVTSSTQVANLYASRAAVADSATTNANLTGDVISVGNLTAYNNAVPAILGGTGSTGGFASPSGIGSSVANTGAFTTLSTSGLFTATNTTVGTNDMILFGHDTSNYNRAILDWNYVSSGSTSNSIGLGFYGASNLFTLNGNGLAVLTGSNASSTVPVLKVTNSNANPQLMIGAFSSSISAGNQAYNLLGNAASGGNSAQITYIHQGSNNAGNATSFGFYGGGGGLFTLYNSTSTAATLSCPLSATSFQSTATLGSALSSVLKAPNVIYYAAGTTTYTTNSNVLYIIVEMVGAGGGGGGCGTLGGGGDGSNGGNTSFNGSCICYGGSGSSGTSGGAGGTFSGLVGTQILAMYGNQGGAINGTSNGSGGHGGGSGFGPGANPGISAGQNSNIYGGGGSGASTSGTSIRGGGGGGAYYKFLSPPVSGYVISVGSGGTGGNAGLAGTVGGYGADGRMIITEYWQ
jgi:hypothetical protein